MDHNDLRIGDAEREQTMEALREHFAQGRLTREELDERLDHALAAKTGRDLAQVTADLPGPRPAYREPGPRHDAAGAVMGDWREAMGAHHAQMQSLHQARHEWRRAHREMRHQMRHQWKGHPGRRHHRGPHPFVGVLFLFMVIGLMVGGFGIFKVLFGVWLVAMVFSLVHRRFHYRG
ncbi:DUF1707 domain-containing protein [Actinomadura sp. ATCC 31491]|uniref:DUF1707 domain-containing protein n=1 Tax=Actinomadura luzonensis TaxID=2805427 RepID=A0ABT0FZE3_9ACTN|nr:DUF1707 domain-containing protein [Actinomadura luzonensis]MCK2217518.1 DUF1707 domain-containing protein [Actinomadura luzonensis]